MKINTKDKYKFTVKTRITPEIYRNFARFDTFLLRKRLVVPIVFFAVFIAIATGLMMYDIPLIAAVCGIFAVAFPISYFNTFSRIMQQNTGNAPQGTIIDDYLVNLSDDGVEVYSEEETAECTWEELKGAYLLSNCIALYIDKRRSFLISEFNEKRYPQIWDYICEKAGSKAKDRRSAIS